MVLDIRTIGLPALVSFNAVARLGGISAAAAHLGMAKSGVSRHIAQLEASLGVKLLERGARSIRLTPLGDRLEPRVRSILAEIDLLRDIALEESIGVSGTICVAATPDFGGVLATRFFPQVRRRYPGLTLALRPGYDFEDMQDPNTDLAFRVGTVKDERLVAKRLGGFHAWVMGSPGIATTHPVSTPADLSSAPCLPFRGDKPDTNWTLHSVSGPTTIPVSGPVAVRSFATLLDLARNGEGYTLLPDFMVREDLAAGRLVRVLPDHRSRRFPVFLTYRPGSRRIARVDAVIALAEEIVPGFLSEE